MAEETKPEFITVLTEINELLVKKKCTARDILHIAKELETNATISLVFASIIQNAQATQKTKKNKGPGKS